MQHLYIFIFTFTAANWVSCSHWMTCWRLGCVCVQRCSRRCLISCTVWLSCAYPRIYGRDWPPCVTCSFPKMPTTWSISQVCIAPFSERGAAALDNKCCCFVPPASLQNSHLFPLQPVMTLSLSHPFHRHPDILWRHVKERRWGVDVTLRTELIVIKRHPFVALITEFYEELLSLIYSLTCENVSLRMWNVFPLMYQLFKNDGFDYFTGVKFLAK